MTEKSNESILSLNTEVEPTLVFEVDGDQYELRTVSHLSTLEEAKLRRLYRREEQLNSQLTKIGSKDDAALERIGTRLVGLRVELIVMMTNLPQEIAEQLPALAQNKLLRAIGKEASELRERGLEEDEGAEVEA
jgi:hypothetical protein